MPVAKILESYEENLLLSALPPSDLESILPNLERVEFSEDETLWERDEVAHHLYFPVSALISLSYESDDGSTVSIATIGRSGIAGSHVLMSNVRTPDRAIVLHGGTVFRMKVASVKDELAECGNFQELLLSYTHVLLATISQNAICNRLHKIEKQLCRWLLDCSFELNTDSLNMTHDRIANVMGVRRESISLAASNLQKRRLIGGGRGEIRILDIGGLKKGSCECYAVVREQLERSLEKFTRDHS